MAGKLAKELKQSKDFASLEGEAALNVLRTAEVLLQKINAVLKPLNLTFTQYNVLRILRGAGEQGLTCSHLGERLIGRDPDITRLLDRMERSTLVTRERSVDDRRIVVTMIRPEGLALLTQAEEPVRSVMKLNMGKLGATNLLSLIELLEKARADDA